MTSTACKCGFFFCNYNNNFELIKLPPELSDILFFLHKKPIYKCITVRKQKWKNHYVWESLAFFDLKHTKTSSCQHIVCEIEAWQWVEREWTILKHKVKQSKRVFASPSNLYPVRHSKRETSSLPDNEPQTTNWLVFPPDGSTWLKLPPGSPSSARPTRGHGCTFQRQNANKLSPPPPPALSYSQGSILQPRVKLLCTIPLTDVYTVGCLLWKLPAMNGLFNQWGSFWATTLLPTEAWKCGWTRWCEVPASEHGMFCLLCAMQKQWHMEKPQALHLRAAYCSSLWQQFDLTHARIWFK